MNIQDAVNYIEKYIPDPSLGLPKEVFYFISRLTPLVNVDLLIRDEKGRILLSWREKEYNHKPGWHIPGGIVRFKENIETRIQEVAKKEIGIKVEYSMQPIAINQIICEHEERGHFISLLYKCFLSDKFIPKNTNLKETDNGYLKWHTFWPKNLVDVQKKIYKKFIFEKNANK